MNIYACVCLIFSSSHSHNDYKTYVVTETCTQTWVQLLPCKHNLPQQHLEIQTQVAIEEMIIFLLLSLSDILIHAESLSVSQAPPPQHIPTSSLSVVDADMSHLEALPYMCCIDISLLTFPFPRRPDCEAPVTMWKRRLRFLNNSSGLMNAFWRHSCAGVTGSVSSVGGE